VFLLKEECKQEAGIQVTVSKNTVPKLLQIACSSDQEQAELQLEMLITVKHHQLQLKQVLMNRLSIQKATLIQTTFLFNKN